MTEDERCELTELLRSECSHCRPNRAMESLANRVNRPWRPPEQHKSGDGPRGRGLPFKEWLDDCFEAKMPDTCVSCGGRIAPGDRVRRVLEYNTGVIHGECP
jgi:hypothetical protein